MRERQAKPNQKDQAKTFQSLCYALYLTITAAFAIFGAFLGAVKYVANIDVIQKLIGCSLISAISLAAVLYFKSFLISSILFGVCNTVAIIAMIVTKTKAQMIGKERYADSLSSILAARTIVIKCATLLGTGACLAITNFASLKMTLWFFILPLAAGVLPFVVRPVSITQVVAKPFND